MNILHTVLYTFSTVLAWRICLTIKRFFSWLSFPLFPWPYCLIQGWYWKEKLEAVTFRYLSVNAIKMMLDTFVLQWAWEKLSVCSHSVSKQFALSYSTEDGKWQKSENKVNHKWLSQPGTLNHLHEVLCYLVFEWKPLNGAIFWTFIRILRIIYKSVNTWNVHTKNMGK